MLPSLAALVAVSWLSLNQAGTRMSEANDLQKHIASVESITSVVTQLQKERGMSCVYLSAEDDNVEGIHSNLVKLHKTLNSAISEWQKTNEGTNEAEEDPTSAQLILQKDLDLHRMRVSSRRIDCTTTLKWYTERIEQVLSQIQSSLMETEQGAMWNMIAGHSSLLKAIDLTGIHRALGAAFFVGGGFQNIMDTTTYCENTGAMKHSLTGVWNSFEDGNGLIQSLKTENKKMFSEIVSLEHEISFNNITGANSTTGLLWFELFTKYINILLDAENRFSSDLLSQVKNTHQKSMTNYYLAIAIASTSMIICPMALIWYIYKGRQMMAKIRQFTDNLEAKTAELNEEKQKTDFLLHQMMPISIVQSLKEKKSVEPEFFDMVTVYYSDILGFTNLASKCSPMQVVGLLNQLYTSCDEILDQYDVYKVETIGDAYMVVSGLPKLNGIFPKLWSCIQLSLSTKEHLEHHFVDQFLMAERGNVSIKGKGKMKTYWLLGKIGFPYRIDVRKAEAKVLATKYWKDLWSHWEREPL